MHPSIIVVEGPNQGAEITLTETRVLVGRAKDCHLRSDNHAVSRHHCSFRVLPTGVVTLTDLNSSNGTFVNGRQLCGEIHLADGDRVKIGPMVIKFCSRSTEKAKSPASGSLDDVLSWLEHERENDHASATRVDMQMPEDIAGEMLARELMEGSDSDIANKKQIGVQGASDKASELLGRLNRALKRKRARMG